MCIPDIFSELPEKEIRLEDIERISLNLSSEIREENGFTLISELPDEKMNIMFLPQMGLQK